MANERTVQHQTYYKNIRALGLEYPELDYDKALPFLLMLPQAITHISYSSDDSESSDE